MGLFKVFKKEKNKDKKTSQDKKIEKVKVEPKKAKENEKPKLEKKGIPKKPVKKSRVGTGQAYQVLLKPHQTEKASIQGAENKYVFQVNPNASKHAIAQAVNDLYGVRPIKIATTNQSGKKVRQGRTRGRTKSWKKAVVTLPKGKSIQIYEGV